MDLFAGYFLRPGFSTMSDAQFFLRSRRRQPQKSGTISAFPRGRQLFTAQFLGKLIFSDMLAFRIKICEARAKIFFQNSQFFVA